MKETSKIIGGLVLAFLLATTGTGLGQKTAANQRAFASINITETPVQAEPLSLSASDLPSLKSLSDAQLETFMNALDATPTIAFDALPRKGLIGTFYSLQYPDWPPLPGDTSRSPVWNMGDFYLISDLNFNYDAPQKGSLKSGGGMQAMAMSGPPGFGDGGDGTNTFTSYGSSYTAPDYGTNLWIAQVALASGYLTGIASNTLADVQYELQYVNDLTQTNWLSTGLFILGSETANWTPLTALPVSLTNNFFIRLRSWADDGSGLPIWWQLQYFGTTGVDPYGNPAGDGWSNLQKFQNGWNPNTFYTPAAPQNFTVNFDGASSTATVSWSPSSGPVTGYTVNRTYYPSSGVAAQSQTFNVSASTFSVHDLTPFTSPYSDTDPTIYAYYSIQAHYSGGDSAGSGQWLEQGSANISLFSASDGSTLMTVAGLPPGTAGLRLTRIDGAAEINYGTSTFDTNYYIPVTSITNGVFQMPAAWANPPVDGYGWDQYYWYVQTVNANGGATSAGERLYDYYYLTPSKESLVPPFYDGRVQLKQNLIFQLRAATVSQTFNDNPTNINLLDGVITSTNYVVSSYNLAGINNWKLNGQPLHGDVLAPFKMNCFYRNFVFDPNALSSLGVVTNGAYFNNTYLTFYLLNSPAYQFQAPQNGATNFPALLGTGSSQWLATSGVFTYDDQADFGISVDNNWENCFITENARNFYGLPFVSAKIAQASQTALRSLDYLAAGGSLPIDPVNDWFLFIYPETAQPQFQTAEYDFWNTSPTWDTSSGTYIYTAIPGTSNFSETNKSQQFFMSSGSSISLAGYAKLAVQNGYSGVYGYLGQYFDQAYKMTNGVATANTTGVLSPYGNFFATEPGPTALVTMPDIDTGARGTCTVYCVSLQLDANHDGNMDLSFNGPDATSLNSPFVFWCNNNYDRRFKDADDNTYYEDDIKIAATPDCNYADDYGHRLIPTKRDLQDFTRLWICGVTSNLLAALPIGSSVTLSWGDVGSPNSSNPTIDLFAAADADGGIGYLTNSTVAAQQTNISTSAYIGRLGPGTSLQLNSLMNQLPTTHFIWCGASNGTGGLTLTITDASGNTLAQSTAYIQIKDIKQMYERWTVGDEPSKAPTNTAYLAAEGLPVGAPKFQYPQPQDTNTSYILYVHGWNMETWEKDRFAESAFKRLYWQGYQGRFGSFRWPTDYGFGTFKLKNPATDPRNFDNSEFNAWRSGIGLTYLLTDLYNEYGNHVYVLAHSMGNIVTSEALRYAGTNQIVNTYVASQGAISAHTYDDSLPDSLFSSSSPKTPNIYNNWFAGNNGGGAGRVINFYNTNDFALAISRWGLDQQLKPDQSITTLGTSYNFDGYPYTGLPHYTPSSVDDTPPWIHFERNVFYTTNYFNMNIIADRYEVSAYAAQARATALGRIAAVHNVAANVKLTTVWPTDSSGHNYGDHFWHSAQFRGDCSQEWNYWNALLFSQTLGFNINNQ